MLVDDMLIEKTHPWRLFDGACQGPYDFSSKRGVLFIFERHFVNFKKGLGIESNNFV